MQHASVIQRLDSIASGEPAAVAIWSSERRVGYAELRDLSQAAARELANCGCTPGEIIALDIANPVTTIAWMLGCLRLGLAYLPIERTMPPQRFESVSRTLGVHRCISDRPGALGGEAKYVGDAIAVEGDGLSDAHPPFDPSRLAYVLLTSGSTGWPKAVGVEMRNLEHYIDAVSSRLRLSEYRTFAMLSGLTTDLGYTMLFGSLAVGGTLNVFSDAERHDLMRVAAALTDHRPEILKTTPSYLMALMRAADAAHDVLPRRAVVLGGETLHWHVVDDILKTAPRLAVYNHYGPTETTIGVATFTVDPAVRRTRTVPVGLALPGVRLAVDQMELPGGNGRSGQLFVAGPTVSRGYIEDDRLTAEAFAHRPDSSDPSALWYATGDMVHADEKGVIEFLGRNDGQVKVGGYRVELGEMEWALTRDSAIVDAAGTTFEVGPGTNVLAAFVVGRGDETPETELTAAARDSAEALLPLHMRPSMIIPIERLPRTSSGKVDRRALAEMAMAHREISGGAGKPKDGPRRVDALENAIAGLFCELLHLERVEADANFFDAGGHSLLALQLVARVRKSLSTDLPLNVVFEGGTPAAIAEFIRNSAASKEPGRLVRMRSTGDERRLAVFIHATAGTVSPYNQLAAALPEEFSVVGIEATAQTARTAAAEGIEGLAAGYLTLLPQVTLARQVVLIGWSSGGLIAAEMASRMARGGGRVDVVLIDTWAPRDTASSHPSRTDQTIRAFAAAFGITVPKSFSASLPLDTQLELVAMAGRGAGVFDASSAQTDAAQLFASYRTIVAAARRYRPNLSKPLKLHLAASSRSARRAGAALGWERVANCALELLEVTGSHYSLLSSALSVEKLAEFVTGVSSNYTESISSSPAEKSRRTDSMVRASNNPVR